MMAYVAELARLSAAARISPGRLAALQGRLLGAAVRAACAGVPLYRRLYREAGVDPAGVASVEDLRRLPVVDHVWYRRQPLEDRLMTGIDPKRCRLRRTSGSSGVPLTVHCTQREILRRQAVWHHVRRRAGLRATWKQLSVGTFHASHISWWTRPWHRCCTADEAPAVIRAYRPDILHGYPSQLLILARRLREQGAPPPKLRAVSVGGETLSVENRRSLEDFFGVRVRDFYGTHEVGPATRPCPAGPGHHVASPYHLIEIVRDGRPAQPGEEGEVYLTTLLAEAMPILRYAVGDRAVAGDRTCACGSPFAKINAFVGRAADVVVRPDGSLVSAMFTNKPFFDNPDVVQHRVTQLAPGVFSVDLVMTADPTAELREAIGRYYGETFGATQVEVRRVPDLPADASGKHKRFISRVERPR